MLYERRNGHFKLQITGHPDFGLSYGQDRLIPIFLATLAVQQQSQTVRFKSGANILEMFGIVKGGKEYRRLVAAFERIFGATIFFGAEHTTAISKVVHRARFNFMREARIWYQGTGDEDNVVVLSDEFFAEVMAHPIPTDLNVITLLAPSPGALDLLSLQRLNNRFRFLVQAVSLPNWDPLNILDLEDLPPNFRNGSNRFVQS